MSSKHRSDGNTSQQGVRMFVQHLRIGWWSLLLFLTLGIVLEAMHGLKLNTYLGVDAETRRLMWTLAHTHGTLIALIHLLYALTIRALPGSGGLWPSYCLTGAGVLMPLGFFLGGLFHYSGDPGLGIFLVPPGGLLLFISVLLTARSIHQNID